MYNLLATTWSSVTGCKTAEWNGNSVPHNTLCQSGFTPSKATCWGRQYSTGDVSLLHHINPETKQHSTNWHQGTPSNKKAEKVPSAGKVMSPGLLRATYCLVLCPEVNHECHYLHIFRCFWNWRALCQKCLMKGLTLQHNSVRPHRHSGCQEATEK